MKNWKDLLLLNARTKVREMEDLWRGLFPQRWKETDVNSIFLLSKQCHGEERQLHPVIWRAHRHSKSVAMDSGRKEWSSTSTKGYERTNSSVKKCTQKI